MNGRVRIVKPRKPRGPVLDKVVVVLLLATFAYVGYGMYRNWPTVQSVASLPIERIVKGEITGSGGARAEALAELRRVGGINRTLVYRDSDSGALYLARFTPCTECQGAGTVHCPTCGGHGYLKRTRSGVCSCCGGSGKIRHASGFKSTDPRQHKAMETTCSCCGGTGRSTTTKRDQPCPQCRGAGRAICPSCHGFGFYMVRCEDVSWPKQARVAWRRFLKEIRSGPRTTPTEPVDAAPAVTLSTE